MLYVLKGYLKSAIAGVNAKNLVVSITAGFVLVLATTTAFFATDGRTTASQFPVTTESEILDGGFNISHVESQSLDWQNRLYAPTHVTKINGMWFIVDCWHNRVIWSNDLYAPISSWNTLDGDLAGPHSIAYGGGYYAVEDTNRHAVNFYAFNSVEKKFVKRQTIELGSRPHRIHFVEGNQSFYVLSSVSQHMHRISVETGTPLLADTQKLEFLENQYTRSFTIVGDEMLFVAGPKKITKTTYKNDNYQVTGSYYVPPAFYGMNDIFYTGKKYILTSTLPNSFGVASSLEDIPAVKDESAVYGFKGRPYYVSQYGNALIVPEIAEYSSVKVFKLDEEHNFAPHATVHEFGEAIEPSKIESFRIPMEQQHRFAEDVFATN